MKTKILTTVFFCGIVLLGVSCTELVTGPQRMWLTMVAMILEGSMARYVVREQARDYPAQSFSQKLLPATLPLFVLLACVLRVLGVFGTPIFN